MPENDYPRFAWEISDDSQVEPVTEDGFETGDFSGLAWEHRDTPWQVTDMQAWSGGFSAQAGNVGHNGSSTLRLTCDCPAGEIRFYVKVSSEADYDTLVFAINGKAQGTWSGERDWEQVFYPVKAGTHTFTWTYSKDISDSQGQDSAWIDEVVLP